MRSLAFAALILGALASDYSIDDPIAGHTAQAIKYDKAGDKENALLSFRAALKHETTRPEGERLANLGVCLMRMQKFDESIEQMQKAMSLKPNSDQKTQRHIQSNWDALLSVLKKNGRSLPDPHAGKEDDMVSAVRDEIRAIYKQHNPEKLQDVDQLMLKYLGREQKFLRMVKEKYGLQAPKPKQPRQKFELHVPRVTADELAANKTLMTGHWAYILTGEVTKWPAMKRWNLDYLKDAIPKEWVDYYPYNMYKLGNKPYVQPYDEAVEKFKLPKQAHSRYMQMRLSLAGWERLVEDLAELPPVFWTEAEWINSCFNRSVDSNGKPTRDTDAIDNFFRVNQWNFLLIGEEGTGIFFHKDHLAAASWQANVVGRKRWILCPNDQASNLVGFDQGDGLNVWKPDYRKFPKFAEALCADVVVEEGEILYYPAYWYHGTKILDTPMIGLTGLMVGVEGDRNDLRHRRVHRQFFEDLRYKCSKCWPKDGPYTGAVSTRTCDDISERWPGAAPPPAFEWCNEDPNPLPGKESYLKACYELWEDHVDTVMSTPNRRKRHAGNRGRKKEF